MTAQQLQQLAAKVSSLPTAQKLHIAAMLIEQDRADVAESIVKAALDDLLAVRLLNIQRAPLR